MAVSRSAKPLGLHNPKKNTRSFLRRLRAASNVVVRKAALERAEAIEWPTCRQRNCKLASSPSSNSTPNGLPGNSDRLLPLSPPRHRASVGGGEARPSVLSQESLGTAPRKVATRSYTVTRIRISEIWTRHPEWSARPVIENLGPEHSVRLPWVQKILADFSHASSSRLTADQRRISQRPGVSSARGFRTGALITFPVRDRVASFIR